MVNEQHSSYDTWCNYYIRTSLGHPFSYASMGSPCIVQCKWIGQLVDHIVGHTCDSFHSLDRTIHLIFPYQREQG